MSWAAPTTQVVGGTLNPRCRVRRADWMSVECADCIQGVAQDTLHVRRGVAPREIPLRLATRRGVANYTLQPKKSSRVHDVSPVMCGQPLRATNPSTGRPPYFLTWSGSSVRALPSRVAGPSLRGW